MPLVERLYRAKWSSADGLGALVITPTRELALQIFDVLRSVLARHYALTAGYITGGKDVAQEQAHIGSLNILVCTPGRLLQHLEQTAGFDTTTVEVHPPPQRHVCLFPTPETAKHVVLSNRCWCLTRLIACWTVALRMC